jgi:Domain of unknown function (DUF5658)
MSTLRRNLLWLLFILLSGADLFLTWRLLSQRGSTVYESNPLAAWLLDRFGWPGLTLFKAVAVIVVLTATAILCRRSPRVGVRVLTFGCTVLSGVVVYSFMLAGAARAWDDSPQVAEGNGAAPGGRFAAVPAARPPFRPAHSTTRTLF